MWKSFKIINTVTIFVNQCFLKLSHMKKKVATHSRVSETEKNEQKEMKVILP